MDMKMDSYQTRTDLLMDSYCCLPELDDAVGESVLR